MFSKFMVVKDPNEVDMMDILEALGIFTHYFQDSLIVEGNSSNAISWVTTLDEGPCYF